MNPGRVAALQDRSRSVRAARKPVHTDIPPHAIIHEDRSFSKAAISAETRAGSSSDTNSAGT